MWPLPLKFCLSDKPNRHSFKCLTSFSQLTFIFRKRLGFCFIFAHTANNCRVNFHDLLLIIFPLTLCCFEKKKYCLYYDKNLCSHFYLINLLFMFTRLHLNITIHSKFINRKQLFWSWLLVSDFFFNIQMY